MLACCVPHFPDRLDRYRAPLQLLASGLHNMRSGSRFDVPVSGGAYSQHITLMSSSALLSADGFGATCYVLLPTSCGLLTLYLMYLLAFSYLVFTRVGYRRVLVSIKRSSYESHINDDCRLKPLSSIIPHRRLQFKGRSNDLFVWY